MDNHDTVRNDFVTLGTLVWKAEEFLCLFNMKLRTKHPETRQLLSYKVCLYIFEN